jgi:hypothetical protein
MMKSHSKALIRLAKYELEIYLDNDLIIAIDASIAIIESVVSGGIWGQNIKS